MTSNTSNVEQDTLKQVSKEVTAVVEKYGGFVVKTEEDASKASDILVEIAKAKKSVAARKEEIIKPLKDHVRFLEGEFRKIEQPIIDADTTVRGAMSAYARAQEEVRAAEQRKIDEKRRKQEEAAAAKGKVLTTPPPVAQAPTKTIASSTGAGSTSMRKVQKIRITDMVALLKNNEVKKLLIEEARKTGLLDKVVKRLVDAGMTLSGVELYDDFVPSVRT